MLTVLHKDDNRGCSALSLLLLPCIDAEILYLSGAWLSRLQRDKMTAEV